MCVRPGIFQPISSTRKKQTKLLLDLFKQKLKPSNVILQFFLFQESHCGQTIVLCTYNDQNFQLLCSLATINCYRSINFYKILQNWRINTKRIENLKYFYESELINYCNLILFQVLCFAYNQSVIPYSFFKIVKLKNRTSAVYISKWKHIEGNEATFKGETRVHLTHKFIKYF